MNQKSSIEIKQEMDFIENPGRYINYGWQEWKEETFVVHRSGMAVKSFKPKKMHTFLDIDNQVWMGFSQEVSADDVKKVESVNDSREFPKEQAWVSPYAQAVGFQEKDRKPWKAVVEKMIRSVILTRSSKIRKHQKIKGL